MVFLTVIKGKNNGERFEEAKTNNFSEEAVQWK